MNALLFDYRRNHLLPLAYTRPIAAFRCGILTLTEKWKKRVPQAHFSYLTEAYLSEKFSARYGDDQYYINGALFANDELVEQLFFLKEGEALYSAEKDILLAARTKKKLKAEEVCEEKFERKTFSGEYLIIENLWDLFSLNGQAIESDYELLTAGRESQALDQHSIHIGERIFIEAGAKVQASTFNSTSGPIYIGKNAEVMEGSVVRGGFALCEGASLKMSAKIYGPTTIGPYSKVGGEVNNSVIFGYSNKGHDGFLGNSVLGEWCNLGADTNVSNLKNNYASIKVWNYPKKGFVDSGKQFCGLMMGDHSKSGINTMFNTATVVGVCANIYGGGFPRSFIPSFSWGGSEKWVVYRFQKAMEVAEKVMERRGLKLNSMESDILKKIFEDTAYFRNF